MGLYVAGFLLLWAASARAGEPTESIRQTTDKILSIVSDPSLKSPEKAAERRRLIRQAVDERFDWEEMSRRTLAIHWRKRSKEEKQAFIELFGKLLERTYLERVEGYSGEEVVYEGERVEGDYALVSVRVKTEHGTDIPVRYRMRRKHGVWLVYDISIEGVSLIQNYRTQFNSILVRSSFDTLLAKLRQKVEAE